MHTTNYPKDLQNFVYALQYDSLTHIDLANVPTQLQLLDYFIQMLDCITSLYKDERVEVHFHPEIFVFSETEAFFSQLFTSLDQSLNYKVEIVFQRSCAFIVNFIGSPETVLVIKRLIKELKTHYPHINETFEQAIAVITTEFLKPTIGDFIDSHEKAIDELQAVYPTIYSLFIFPLQTAPFREGKLFNFFCNPWIYQRITIYLAYHEHQRVLHERIEAPLKWLEESLQIIRNQTNDESWKEFSQKTHALCYHSNNLEAFATQSSGLLGEIKAAVQFIKNQCQSKDLLIFLPDLQKDGKNCDLMIIRFETGEAELIESKAKSPRHGLDVKIAGDAQIRDDFFDNFTKAISLYLQYLQCGIQPVLGLTLDKCYPLFSAYEGSRYGIALPLVENILTSQAMANVSVSTFSSEQKLVFLLRVLFLRPLTLGTACVQLASESQRLVLREQTTKEALQKKWVSSLLKQATDQLEETWQRQLAKGQKISKMHVALDLALSYRLLQDPFSYNDGNIKEIAEQTLQEAFQPFKEAVAAKRLNLHLLIIQL